MDASIQTTSEWLRPAGRIGYCGYFDDADCQIDGVVIQPLPLKTDEIIAKIVQEHAEAWERLAAL